MEPGTILEGTKEKMAIQKEGDSKGRLSSSRVVFDGEGERPGLAGWDHLCAVSHKAPFSIKCSPPEDFCE